MARLRGAPAVAGAVTLVLSVGLLGLQVATWNRVLPRVVVAGTSVGGLSQTDASERIAPQVQAVLDRPLELRAGTLVWSTSARQLGMTLDPTELSAAAFDIGREGNPVARLSEELQVVVTGDTIPPRSQTDETALLQTLQSYAQQVDQPARDAGVTVAPSGQVQIVSAQSGKKVDLAASSQRVAEALASGSQAADLVVNDVSPSVTDDQIQATRDQITALLGDASTNPVTLQVGSDTRQISRDDLMKLISIQRSANGGAPTLTANHDAITDYVTHLAQDVDEDVQDARFSFNGGTLKVIRPSQEGRTLDQSSAVQTLETDLLAGQRTIPMPVQTVEPAVSSDDPQSLGITDLIDSGSTSFAGSIADKVWNIQLAAQRLNGVVIPPGGTFSFNKEIGPTTLETGYKWGYGITSGADGVQTVPSVAGGICQVATTLFQPVFWSGYTLEERYWHLYWIPAYTSRGVQGLDVTVDEDANLDFKWSNPTNDYILIQASADDSNVYFSLYGTKPNWTVHVDPGTPTNIVPADPKPIAEAEPSMPWGQSLPVEAARDGFDMEVKRTVTTPGDSDPRVLDLKSSYVPAQNITLVGTQGMPSGADLDAALQRVLGPASVPQNKPAGTGSAAQTDATAQPVAKPTTPPSAATTTNSAAAPTAATTKEEPTAAPAKPALTQAPARAAKPAATSGPVAAPTAAAPAPTASAPAPTAAAPAPAPVAPTAVLKKTS